MNDPLPVDCGAAVTAPATTPARTWMVPPVLRQFKKNRQRHMVCDDVSRTDGGTVMSESAEVLFDAALRELTNLVLPPRGRR